MRPRVSETDILVEVHQAVVQTGRALLWRNNGGVATFGVARVRYGLGVGGADLVGLVRPTGRAFALEVKTPAGRLSKEQKAWHRAWAGAGGFVACVRSVDEALRALREATIMRAGQRVIITANETQFRGQRGTIASTDDGVVMVLLDGETEPMRFGAQALAVVVGEQSEPNLSGAE